MVVINDSNHDYKPSGIEDMFLIFFFSCTDTGNAIFVGSQKFTKKCPDCLPGLILQANLVRIRRSLSGC